eukprot:COSAG03_NODE_19762_length_330_cov_1.069264_1_plen_20_part_10
MAERHTETETQREAPGACRH